MIRRLIQPPQTAQEPPISEDNPQHEVDLQQPPVSSMSLIALPEASNSFTRSTHFRVMQNMTCGSFCPCTCHKKKQFKSPTFFNQVLGSLFVGYSALPYLTTPCDSHLCRRVTGSTVDVLYVFPNWFLNRIVSMKLRKPGPDLQLKTLRVCPYNSEIFSAVTCQDTFKVRAMLVDGSASILDVNEEGESLLTVSILVYTIVHS